MRSKNRYPVPISKLIRKLFIIRFVWCFILIVWTIVVSFSKEAIVDALKHHLVVPETLCLNALIEYWFYFYDGSNHNGIFEQYFSLTIALCKDLQGDFHKYFWHFFNIILEILDRTKMDNVDLLEQCFICYAHLFKCCWRKLVPELETVFAYENTFFVVVFYEKICFNCTHVSVGFYPWLPTKKHIFEDFPAKLSLFWSEK